MSIFEDTNPRELKELLRQIDMGETVLPDFQRDFVWEPNATQELICSIASNFLAGSLLRIRNTQNLFASRAFEGAPAPNGQHATYLVLDGQQRLTSLYQAFYGKGDYRYFLSLKDLVGGAEFEECASFLRANHKDARRYEDEAAQAEDMILPLSVLKGGAGSFTRWSQRIARRQTDNDKRARVEDFLSEIEEKWVRTIDDYKFPVVTLSDRVNADAVCTIFETLNRTGVKLSVFELLTARFWPLNINLRHLWDKARSDYPIIADFDTDAYYALQTVTLLARKSPSCKRSEVLDLTADDIHRCWAPAIKGLAKALEVLRDDCGVIVPAWLPYNTIVVPMAAIFARYQATEAHAVGAARRKIVRWFWCSVFAQIYEKGQNGQSAKDFVEVIDWLAGGDPPKTVADFKFDVATLRDTTKRQRAIYRGLICLILSRHPRDFHNGARITGDLMIERHIDDHHIFPDAYLARVNVSARLRVCILNRTLIDRSTNIRIQDRAPSEYLAEIRDALGPSDFDSLLKSHLLPSGSASPLPKDDFDGFLAWREAAFADHIKAVTAGAGPV